MSLGAVGSERSNLMRLNPEKIILMGKYEFWVFFFFFSLHFHVQWLIKRAATARHLAATSLKISMRQNLRSSNDVPKSSTAVFIKSRQKSLTSLYIKMFRIYVYPSSCCEVLRKRVQTCRKLLLKLHSTCAATAEKNNERQCGKSSD